jgi:uncharacterized protein (DUF302 family)
MDYGRTIRLELPYQEAVPKVKEAFKQQGFGTLTEIDVKATLKEKLSEDILPCNIVVRADGPGTLVQALDPKIMVTVPGRAELEPIAEEAGRRIQAALDTLQAR